MQNVEKFISDFAVKFDSFLVKMVPTNKFSSKLYEAMIYAIQVGGKRLRPLFLIEIAKIYGVDINSAMRSAVAIEFIHCYSLVHDDLPAMDDDDLRRGHITCHKKFDDATAILVGDAFQSLSFQILSDKETHTNAQVRCNLINELSKASGALGMVGGQMLDLDAEKKKLTLEQILILQELKTGELFKFCCIAGPILAEKEDLDLFKKFAQNLGLAFQIKDDLLDIEGDEKKLGKKVNKDSSRGKQTLISYYGKQKAKKKSQELIYESIKLLKHFGKKADRVIDLTNFVISRNV
ncbi:MAG: polyprenyl synthetase family protein [Alphaproteobacteria bacterium]